MLTYTCCRDFERNVVNLAAWSIMEKYTTIYLYLSIYIYMYRYLDS